MKLKKIIKTVSIIALLVLVGFLAFPYVKAEYYTAKYGDVFENLYTQTSWIEELEYCKVVDYDSTQATVIYIEKGHNTCFEAIFVLNNGEWDFDKLDCIWSKSGSADGFYWPYYR